MRGIACTTEKARMEAAWYPRGTHTRVHYDRPVGGRQGGASYGAHSFRSSLLQCSVVDSLTSVLLDGKTSHRRRRY